MGFSTQHKLGFAEWEVYAKNQLTASRVLPELRKPIFWTGFGAETTPQWDKRVCPTGRIEVYEESKAFAKLRSLLRAVRLGFTITCFGELGVQKHPPHGSIGPPHNL